MALSEGEAIYFDGRSARRRAVQIRLGERLDILENGKIADMWLYPGIRRADSGSNALRLRSAAAADLARLEIRDAVFAAAVVARCPSLDEGDRRKSLLPIVFWSLAAACSIVLLAIYGAPVAADRLAPLVPSSLEHRLGDAADNQIRSLIGGRICARPEGAAALGKLVGALAGQSGLGAAVEAKVLDSKVANAFALPGGRVYVLRGLLERAENADELAGVIAHELGHVAHRDALREMISSGGAAFLFGLLFGDVSGSGAVILAGRHLLSSSYSRGAEAAADAFSAKTMRGLGRSPVPLGQFLIRLTGAEKGGAIGLLASHPLSQDRLAALQASDAPATGAPLLNDEEWRALKTVCNK
jgi:Zn-dependent protease with chaperone function